MKLVLKPHYTKKHVTKEEYKDIMRKAVPKVRNTLNSLKFVTIKYYRIKYVYRFISYIVLH